MVVKRKERRRELIMISIMIIMMVQRQRQSMARVLQERVKTAQTTKSSQACRKVRPVVVPVNKAIPLIALQECGPVSARFFQEKRGAE